MKKGIIIIKHSNKSIVYVYVCIPKFKGIQRLFIAKII